MSEYSPFPVDAILADLELKFPPSVERKVSETRDGCNCIHLRFEDNVYQIDIENCLEVCKTHGVLMLLTEFGPFSDRMTFDVMLHARLVS